MNIIIIIILTFDPFEQNIVQMFYNWIASTIPKKMDVWNMNIFKLSIFIQFNHTITINKTFLLQFSHEMTQNSMKRNENWKKEKSHAWIVYTMLSNKNAQNEQLFMYEIFYQIIMISCSSIRWHKFKSNVNSVNNHRSIAPIDDDNWRINKFFFCFCQFSIVFSNIRFEKI